MSGSILGRVYQVQMLDVSTGELFEEFPRLSYTVKEESSKNAN